MNTIPGTVGLSCPVPTNCTDNQGTMPSCAGLAVPYVPFQQTGSRRYNQTEALAAGTLFPGLNLPFKLKVEPGAIPATALTELQALEFVVLELGHYLDTHPDDTEAFGLFQQYVALEKSAKVAYEAAHGPLTRASAATGTTYRWLQEPWPWSYEQNEVT